MRRRPVIGVMGAGEADGPTLETARRLGRVLAEAGWVVLSGGRPTGVMDAVSAGVKEVPGGLTLGILPGGPDSPVSANVDIAVFTDMGHARNVINVLTSDVVIACGVGGPGTASEVALALKAGRPTILLCASSEAAAFFRAMTGQVGFHEAATPDAAVALIEQRLGIHRWAPG
jgi:uncharacterized protein (TIGR00725 family)